MTKDEVSQEQQELRGQVVALGASLFARGLTAGRTGNLSVRVSSGFLVTPTGSNLGQLSTDQLSLVDLQGRHLDGPRPSKEAFLHAAIYRARPQDSAVVHTHSTHAAAVSCLADVDPHDVLPPLTAYYVMRVGRCRCCRTTLRATARSRSWLNERPARRTLCCWPTTGPSSPQSTSRRPPTSSKSSRRPLGSTCSCTGDRPDR